MNHRMTLAAGLLMAGAWSGSWAQPPADKKDPQSAIEPRSGPGAGQKFLAQFVGDWNVEKSFHPREGQPVKTMGTCRQDLIHGGRFLRSEFTFEGANGKSTGTGLIGFDPSTGLFTSVWIDSRSTRVSHRIGSEKFDGKSIVLKGAALDGNPTRQSKTVTTVEDGGQKIVHTQYGQSADGNERIVMKLVMTKAPPTDSRPK